MLSVSGMLLKLSSVNLYRWFTIVLSFAKHYRDAACNHAYRSLTWRYRAGKVLSASQSFGEAKLERNSKIMLVASQGMFQGVGFQFSAMHTQTWKLQISSTHCLCRLARGSSNSCGSSSTIRSNEPVRVLVAGWPFHGSISSTSREIKARSSLHVAWPPGSPVSSSARRPPARKGTTRSLGEDGCGDHER